MRAFAVALGVDPGAVTSPTFVLIHEYDGRIPVSHFDAYRLAGPERSTRWGRPTTGTGKAFAWWSGRTWPTACLARPGGSGSNRRVRTTAGSCCDSPRVRGSSTAWPRASPGLTPPVRKPRFSCARPQGSRSGDLAQCAKLSSPAYSCLPRPSTSASPSGRRSFDEPDGWGAQPDTILDVKERGMSERAGAPGGSDVQGSGLVFNHEEGGRSSPCLKAGTSRPQIGEPRPSRRPLPLPRRDIDNELPCLGSARDFDAPPSSFAITIASPSAKIQWLGASLGERWLVWQVRHVPRGLLVELMATWNFLPLFDGCGRKD